MPRDDLPARWHCSDAFPYLPEEVLIFSDHVKSWSQFQAVRVPTDHSFSNFCFRVTGTTNVGQWRVPISFESETMTPRDRRNVNAGLNISSRWSGRLTDVRLLRDMGRALPDLTGGVCVTDFRTMRSTDGGGLYYNVTNQWNDRSTAMSLAQPARRATEVAATRRSRRGDFWLIIAGFSIAALTIVVWPWRTRRLQKNLTNR